MVWTLQEKIRKNTWLLKICGPLVNLKNMGDDRVLRQYITRRIDSEVPASHAEK